MLAHLDKTGEDQISLTDPDSRAMAAHTRVAVGYNVQVAIDVKHKLIVEQQVTNQIVDMGMLTPTAEPAKEVLGVETIDVVADKGYFKIEDIEACEKAGIVPYVPRPQRGPSVKAGLFRKDEFTYDAGSDRAVDRNGALVDVMFREHRDMAAAKAFSGRPRRSPASRLSGWPRQLPSGNPQ
jgi:hypothetical protein